MIEQEEKINLNVWKNVKSQFQHCFPRVVQGVTEGINAFADCC
jgi:hypothetical protein